MNTTERIKRLLAARATMLPITDKQDFLVGYADTQLFLTDGLRLAARIALAGKDETPVKDHVQEFHRRRGADDYAKAYIMTLWDMQTGFFGPSLQAIHNKGVDGWGLRGIRNGHINEDLLKGFTDGFDHEQTHTLPPKGGNQHPTTPTPRKEA